MPSGRIFPLLWDNIDQSHQSHLRFISTYNTYNTIPCLLTKMVMSPPPPPHLRKYSHINMQISQYLLI
ncbi:hypothetical protein K445DRAFT_319506 [Daldinia sp. EC12]|nr:hypothetical protein K445DRAFT_319506 [Daldinia sp. EC12]